mmetsp:Transcript_2428/g.8671  ORF Transcript_2428/g.8671 Transcript_2428/m.8671 type:complete len:216 (-) Transcript_2428:27-674(-)
MQMSGLLRVLVLVALVNACLALSFVVPASREECFVENLEKGTEVGLTYQVTEGGFLDIDVAVTAPDNQVIYAGRREKAGRYFFVTHVKGPYRMCFSNKMSTVTSKTVNMVLNIGVQRSEEEIVRSIMAGREGQDLPNIPHLMELQSSIMQLADGLYSIQREEKYLRIRERVHRDTSESTNARVLGWSLVETIVLIGISLWQIFYLRRFFEVKRTV